MKKAVFTIEDYPKAYIGYTSHNKWKGIWDMAHFELAEAQRVADGFNECAEHPMQYDPIYDQFFVWDAGNDDYDIVKGKDCHTEDGIKHLYEIGIGWFWSAVDEQKCLHLAQQIEEFIFYYDTYNYMDEYDLKRYDVVEEIKNQLRELKTFQQAYEIFNDDDLPKELKFNKLGGILKL